MTITEADHTMSSMSTRPACQFTAKEETVIGLNESRKVFRDFEKIGGFNDVPVRFLMISKKFIWNNQRVLTKKASVMAILCDC